MLVAENLNVNWQLLNTVQESRSIDKAKDDFSHDWYRRHSSTIDVSRDSKQTSAHSMHLPFITNWKLGTLPSMLLAGVLFTVGAESQTAPERSEQRILVKRPYSATKANEPLSIRGGQPMHRLRGSKGSLEVFALPPGIDREAALRELRVRPDIEYAVAERRRFIHAVPTDTLFTSQWYLQNDSAQPAAIAANLAWDISTGSNGIVVAVLDTGVRFDHPDLYPSGQSGKLLPGFDFVSNSLTANDGGCWDADPSDPGDWISQADLDRSDDFFDECGDGPNQNLPSDSSWHGTRVAGLIAAQSNNGSGIAGASWGAYILPVRVMGKCGGYDGDIIDGMRWAAGIQVSGAPPNPYPAKIINLSLGSKGACTAGYQDVINELTQLGVAVVISAGNDGGTVHEPANCPGAIAVAGLRHAGTKVGFSSLGPEIAISAPGGNCVNEFGACLFPLNTTSDSGATTPLGPTYTDSVNINVGTSFSAPLVAGVAALMRSVNDKLTVRQLRERLQQSAQAFPTTTVTACRLPSSPNDFQISECACTTTVCGAGMLYAPAAVTAAQRPIAHIVTPVNLSAGAIVMLDSAASAAACNRTIASHSWSVLSVTGTSTPVISNADQPVASVSAPSSGSFTLRLTITDNEGAIDFADITITATSASTTSTPVAATLACPVAVIPPSSQAIPGPAPQSASPPPPPRESGGSGAFKLWLLAMLSLLLATRYFSNSFTKPLKY
jgi:serine protease